MRRLALLLMVTMWWGFGSPVRGADPLTIPLWSDSPPRETTTLPPEQDTTKPSDNLIAGRRLIRLGNISRPTITIYKPEPARDTGAAVMVCPGGGYNILAWDLEGTEVCEWLNSIGVTAVLLKYRVPARPGIERHELPWQDAQRALGIVRHRAVEFGLDPQRIGVLGFSAGAHLAALVGNRFEPRAYDPLDAADAVSCRPDFMLLIYPGYLADKANGDRVPELVQPAPGRTPPAFLTMAQDDPVRVENVLSYYTALQRAGVPAELHVYPKGGHGYGLRRTDNPVTHWPDRAAEWLKAGGWLERAK